MPYYGEGLPYYYGGPYATHSSLMTSTPRAFHTPLSRFSPHLSTISESPLSTLRRYSPVSVPTRPRRVIDTADIDVSTPRILSGDGNQRSRLRRDRPTIKIRSQALKDNPALREHNERHEKSVGELLVEKFLIKDKKLEEAEPRLQPFHQVSPEKEDDEELQQAQKRITRRFTRRRSSADIQLDPEQLEREVAYAQVQAKVLDTLVAEEQAEIENEVRRGTLIKKGTVGGPRNVAGFFRSDGESVSQGEEEAAAQKMRKSLKKVKKKKRSTEKPSPPDDEERERRSSTSSDVSVDLQREDKTDRKQPKSQMFKIEASNSVGDFSTIVVGARPDDRVKIIEQFRESVKIPVPRKMGIRKIERDSVEEESETEVVLPVKRPYVKDTSRNSVHFTVKTPPDSAKNDPLKMLDNVANGLQKKDERDISSSIKDDTPEATKKPESPVSKTRPAFKDGKLKKELVLKSPEILKQTKNGLSDKGGFELSKKETIRTDTPESPRTQSKPQDQDVSSFSKSETPSGNEESKDAGSEITKMGKNVSQDTDFSNYSKNETTVNDGSEVGSQDKRGFSFPKFQTSKKEVTKDDSTEVLESNEIGFQNKRISNFSKPQGTKREITKDDSSEILKPNEIGSQDKRGLNFSKPQASTLKKEVAKSDSSEPEPRDKVDPSFSKTRATQESTLKKEATKDATETLKPKTEPQKGKLNLSKTQAPPPSKKEPTRVDSFDSPASKKEITTNDTTGILESKTEPQDRKTTAYSKTQTAPLSKKDDSPNKTLKQSKSVPMDEASSSKSRAASTPKKEEAERRAEPSIPRKPPQTTQKTEASIATLAVDPLALAREASANGALPSLPKPSKINADENNAVEAPKLSLRDAEYLANATKIERDENVGPLPGKKTNKAVTLTNASSSRVPGGPTVADPTEEHPKAENRSGKTIPDDATAPTKLVTQTTLSKAPKCDATDDSLSVSKDIDKGDKVKGDTSARKFAKKDEEPSKIPFRLKKIGKELASEDARTEVPWRTKSSKTSVSSDVHLNRSVSVDCQGKESSIRKPLKQSISVNESSTSKMPVDKQQSVKSFETLNGENGTLSKSTSTESIDFWSEIRGPESPNAAPRRPVENLEGKELEKKKEVDPKISVASAAVGSSNVSVIEEESTASKETTRVETDAAAKKGPKRKKNLSIAIAEAREDAFSTVKRREDSSTSTNTPDTCIPVSEISTPVFDVSVPLINIVAATTPIKTEPQVPEDEEDPQTPTNEWPETGLSKISKWSNQNDLSNANNADVEITPVPSKDVSATCTPEASPESSKKKKVVRKKKSSTTKKGSSGKEAGKESKDSKKSSSKSTQESPKPPEPKKASPKATPTQKPLDLIRMFYTTPSALLTATPRDLSKVRRAKIKRRKHHSRTPSVSSDSTGSTTSTATTESTDGSRSTCTELDDDPDKRMNSTRSNDSGFDGSPRISTPSQSSDTQRNSDSSDHFPSGRITPPATNLPRFKKYAVTDFNFLKVLGKGSFGKVLLAELRGTECVYAVKCLKKDVVLEDDDVECTLIERKVLTLATRHPYLCHLFCTFQTDSHLFFVMEYLNGGDLMFHIQKSGRFSETRARFYAAEIWSGLNFLHNKGIVYRDLKLDNVLLDFEGHIRIADFGMCKLQIFLDRTADTFCGTPDYMAPEIIKGLKYNQAVDWWSYGVLLYEMLTGQSPFSGCDEDELFWSICNERPFIPRYLSQEATDIVVCLLEKDSGKRLIGREIKLHGFFQSLPWDRLEVRQLEAPFKPALEHTLDTKYFDTAFTAERPRLTPVPDQILTSMDQGVFREFSYTNPNATD
ncbi:dentin sialophosphoprotein-like isoform X1 [Hylaeus anthracinus]|uniref:dentin sialophosphoprotein-like isoform X1 n=1 Tax=Hylaeus anthracinus TaxID=313031 RepID=UPI0023B92B45|nr:dentin sialophosphoprotein-like isoform X1 [Hylaeus anthracinus]